MSLVTIVGTVLVGLAVAMSGETWRRMEIYTHYQWDRVALVLGILLCGVIALIGGSL